MRDADFAHRVLRKERPVSSCSQVLAPSGVCRRLGDSVKIGTMNPLKLQAVMIDLDGTLVDTIGDFEVALNRALADVEAPTAHRSLL